MNRNSNTSGILLGDMGINVKRETATIKTNKITETGDSRRAIRCRQPHSAMQTKLTNQKRCVTVRQGREQEDQCRKRKQRDVCGYVHQNGRGQSKGVAVGHWDGRERASTNQISQRG